MTHFKSLFSQIACLLFICAGMQAQNVDLVAVDMGNYLAPGDYNLRVLVKNVGSATVNSFTVEWQLNNGSTQTATFDNLNIASYATPLVYVSDETFQINDLDEYTLDVEITEVNGGNDSSTGDNSLEHNIQRLLQVSDKIVLLEKVTATWCPNCPAAQDILENILDDYPDNTMSVSIHRSDNLSMSSSADNNFLSFYGSGQPRGTIDREVFPTIINGEASSPGLYRSNYWTQKVATQVGRLSPVHLSASTDYDNSDRLLTVDIDATFLADMEGEYRFNCYVLENGIQANQSGTSDPAYDTHNRTVREMLGGAWGTANSINGAITTNSQFSHQYTYTVPDDFDDDEMYVVVVVQQYGDDASERANLNALEVEFDMSAAHDLVDAPLIACSEAPDAPVVDDNNTIVCLGETLTLDANASVPSDYDYQWQLNGSDIDGETSQSLTTTTPGSYSVYLTNNDPSAPCLSNNSNSVNITVSDIALYDIDYTINDLTVTFTVDQIGPGWLGDNSFSWSFGDGDSSFVLNPVHTFDAPGVYPVCPTSFNECGEFGECYLVKIPHPYELDCKVALEGAYEGGGNMSTDLTSLIPLSQPYDVAPYNYNGIELLNQVPNDMVDWVLVEIREGSPGTSMANTTLIETRAAILLSDGSIKDLDEISGVGFSNLVEEENYHIVIRHRNHLDIISANAIATAPAMTYDFTNAQNQAAGNQQLKDMGDGFFVMHAGDYNNDGIIQTTDFDLWKLSPAVNNTYSDTDGNLDKVVQVTDYDTWFFNKAKVGNVEIQF